MSYDPKLPVLQYVGGRLPTQTQGERWGDAIILLDFRRPYAAPSDPSMKVVIWSPGSEAFLRKLPCTAMCCDLHDLVWDVYGDDFETVEKAQEALKHAPTPRKPHVTREFEVRKHGL